MIASDIPSDINKNDLYGKFQRQMDREHNLYMTAAHKSLDIPESNMGDINANKSGMTWQHLLVVALMLIAGAAGTYFVTKQPSTSPANNQQTVTVPSPVTNTSTTTGGLQYGLDVVNPSSQPTVPTVTPSQ